MQCRPLRARHCECNACHSYGDHRPWLLHRPGETANSLVACTSNPSSGGCAVRCTVRMPPPFCTRPPPPNTSPAARLLSWPMKMTVLRRAARWVDVTDPVACTQPLPCQVPNTAQAVMASHPKHAAGLACRCWSCLCKEVPLRDPWRVADDGRVIVPCAAACCRGDAGAHAGCVA